MPNWKKVITSGSNAHLNHITASSYTGSFVGDGSGLTSVTSTVDIDGLGAGTSLHQTQDHFMFSDNGTEKKITFSNLEDAIFGNVSGNATIAAGGALALADNSVGNDEMADNAIGNAELKQDDDIVLQSLTTTNNISGSTIEGQTLTADVFLSSPSASLTNITTTNITASGTISASGDGFFTDLTVDDDLAVLGQIELGHASDTSLTRASAGDVNIEGNIIYRAGGTDVPVTDGGTGVGTLTDGGVLLGNGTGAIQAMAVLTDGQMIVGDGTTDPVAESGATLRTSIGVGTADSVLFTNISASGNITGSDVQGETITTNVFLSAPSASITNLTNTNITSSGNISSSGQLIAASANFNEGNITNVGQISVDGIIADPDSDVTIGLGTGGISFEANTGDTFHYNSNQNNADFQFAGENNQNLFYIDSSTDRVGIGTSTPGKKLTVQGNISASGNITASSYTGSFVGDGSGLTNVSATVADESVTLAKLAHAAANTVLVRDANSAGDPSFKAVTNTQILIGDGTGFTAAALSGDVTMTNAGVTSVADNKIGNSELKQNDDITLQSLTTTNNISGSTIEGQTLTADVFLSSPSASIVNLTNTNITSSGNISSSKNVIANQLTASAFQFIGSGTAELEVEGHITASGNISASGGITAATLDTPQIFNTGLKIGRDSTDLIDFATADNVIGFRVGDNDEMKLNTTNLQPATSNGLALGAANRQWSDLFLAEGAVINFDNGDVTITQTGNNLAIAGTDSTTFVGNISASGNITGSIIEGQTLTADVFLSAPSASLTNITTTNITASGNISASGIINTSRLRVDNFIALDSSGDIGSLYDDSTINNIKIGRSGAHITASGNISASGEISTHVGQHIFSKTSTTDADAKGDVVFFGGTTSMDNGKIYHYKSDGTWELADADAVATCDGLLAVALGAASDTNGMLLRGTVTLDHDPGAVGDVLFLATGGTGQATATAPSGNTDIVRVIGYCLDASNGQIWFNPSSTFVEVSA